MNKDTRNAEQRVRAAFTASEPLTRDWDATPHAVLNDHVVALGPDRPAWRRWQGPLLAAAAVASVAIATLLLAQRTGPSGAPAAAPHSSSASKSSTAPTISPPSRSSASAATSASTPPVIVGPGRTAQLGPPNPQVGVSYPFDLLTHCGIRATIFGGREWRAVHPQPEPAKLPDAHGITHYDGYTSGIALLTDQSTLKFTVHDSESTANGQSYLFTPATRQQAVCA